jgi:hypothetical protein
MRQRVRIDEVVDSNHFDVCAPLVGSAQEAPSHPSESVDPDAYRHNDLVSV